jgi:uncharacterized circularly permuted ATP-grasp superfamily protein
LPPSIEPTAAVNAIETSATYGAGVADLFSDYPFGRAWDEMFSSSGVTRPAYDAVVAAVQSLDADELKARAEG